MADFTISASSKRKQIQITNEDSLEIIPLGAGNEVGRSCVLLRYKGKTVMFDCGLHPAKNGLDSLPYMDCVEDLSTIDLALITHFHIDHAAAVPYLLQKTNFKGRTFMTHPTRAIYKIVVTDYVRVSNIDAEDVLYDSKDVEESINKIELLDYHQQVEHNGIKFWCFNAGHVLGAAMFMVEIAGVRVLYTGDFSRQEDRHLMAAEIPDKHCDVLIVESTYGVQDHEPRKTREQRFTKYVSDTVRGGGKCLIPVFAIGRAQELMLLLEDHWKANGDLHKFPIYCGGSMAKKCINVYQTYINMMNERIRAQFNIQNPFDFKHVSYLIKPEEFNDVGPCVVIASPGMLQNGTSRELFERWCGEKKNSVVIPGYTVEGTLAKTIMNEPVEVLSMHGMYIPMKMQVHYISFSAHSDCSQTSDFIRQLKPSNIVLVHGEANEMARLKDKLNESFSSDGISVFTPCNGVTVNLQFQAAKIARVVGLLSETVPCDGMSLSGILTAKNFRHVIMHPKDLPTFTVLRTSVINQRQRIATTQPFVIYEQNVKGLFETVRDISEEHEGKWNRKIVVMDAVTVTEGNGSVVLEWETSPVNDMIADALLCLILQSDTSPAAAKMFHQIHEINEAQHQQGEGEEEDHNDGGDDSGANTTTAQKILEQILYENFGSIVKREESALHFLINGHAASIDVATHETRCDNDEIKQRIQQTFERARVAVGMH